MPDPVGRRDDACYAQDDESLQSTNPPLASADDDQHDLVVQSSTPAAPARPSSRSTGKDCDMVPDYLSISGGAAVYAGGSATLTVDRYEDVYFTGSVSMATRGLGGSVMAGYLRDPDHPCDPPSEQKLESFLKGWSRSEILGVGLAAAVTTSGDMRAYEYGLASPQAGVNISHGWLLHDHETEPHPKR